MYHEFQYCLALCCIVVSLPIFSLFMHLNGSPFVCASCRPHVIHVCLIADWHFDCARDRPILVIFN